jgi:hypothetical protein
MVLASWKMADGWEETGDRRWRSSPTTSRKDAIEDRREGIVGEVKSATTGRGELGRRCERREEIGQKDCGEGGR